MPLFIKCRKIASTFALLIFIFLVVGCASSKKFAYFNDIPNDSLRYNLPALSWPESFIQKDDILEIKISGKNEVTANDFNARSANFGNGQAVIPQYLVDKNGDIEFYLVGKIKVEGLTVESAKDKIAKTISAYLIEPVVNVRITNFRFSVLGEVKLPGSYSIPHEKISVLEALGYAGDINYLGKKSIVKIYRDSSGARVVGTLDLTKKSIFSSPFFYLQRNDVVYVETDTKLRQTTDALSKVSLIISSISAALTVVYLLIRN